MNVWMVKGEKGLDGRTLMESEILRILILSTLIR